MRKGEDKKEKQIESLSTHIDIFSCVFVLLSSSFTILIGRHDENFKYNLDKT